jgi:hypothetical protein
MLYADDMKNLMLSAALVCAVSASAQVSGSPDNGFGDAFSALKSFQAQNAKLAPAPVDPKPVAELYDRLAKDGDRVEMTDGVQKFVEYVYDLTGSPDKQGRFQNLHVAIEPSDPDAASRGQPVQDLVLRSAYSALEAQSEDWTVGKDGSGHGEIWHFIVSADGRLLRVDRLTVPLKPGPDGKPSFELSKQVSTLLSPSDKSVQNRWKALVKKLLTLGPKVEI